jgi:hypothetical protein
MEELVMFGFLLLGIILLLALWIFVSSFFNRMQDIDDMYKLNYKEMDKDR